MNQYQKLYTPTDSAIAFIDHQPQMLFGVASMDRASLMNNVTLLAKVAKEYNIPTVLSSVETESFSGYVWPQLLDVFPGKNVIERSSMNSWDSMEFRKAIEATGRKNILICGLWTEVCVTWPTIEMLGVGYNVYVVEDCCGATSATFGEPVTAMELSPDGAGYRLNTRFARFINVPELMQIFRQSADVQTAAMLNLPRPKLDGEKPTVRNAPATEELKKFVQELAARAERLKTGRVDPSEDNMLKITSEGRKAALDLRLMKPSAPDDPQGKVNQAIENIFRIWQESKPERSAQLVFCDLSTPKDKGFSVYRDAAEKLERLGVPSAEITFIQDYDSDASKLALFRDVRAGRVRVLFGSTQKMGSGTNVQERLIALHHFDAPWRPADVEQREGRILRQGNKNEVISIYRYVTEGSFDAYMWQTLETKAKFIAQVMSGDMTMRRLEDLDSAALTYAEVKAIASGNPLVIEKAQVDAELIKLTRLRSAHAEEQYRIRTNLRRSHEDAEAFTGRLTNLRQDIAARQDTSGDNFKIELEGQILDNRGIAGELVVRRAEKIKNRFGEDVRIGRFAGFDLFMRPTYNDCVEMIVRGKNSYAARVTDTAQGTIRSLEANVQGFEERASKLEYDIADANKRAKELETKVGAHFEREERYRELIRRQSEIEEKLDLTKNQAPSQVETASADENELKCSKSKNRTETVRRNRRVGAAVKP